MLRLAIFALATLTLTLATLADPQSGESRQPHPATYRVSCVATNHPYHLVHFNKDAGTSTVEEVEDWRVECKIEVKGEKVYEAELPLARPTAYLDAMTAINEFRTKKAPQVMREMKHK